MDPQPTVSLGSCPTSPKSRKSLKLGKRFARWAEKPKTGFQSLTVVELVTQTSKVSITISKNENPAIPSTTFAELDEAHKVEVSSEPLRIGLLFGDGD